MANDLISHEYIMRPPYKKKKKPKTQGLKSLEVGEYVETGESDAPGDSKESPSPSPTLPCASFTWLFLSCILK